MMMLAHPGHYHGGIASWTFSWALGRCQYQRHDGWLALSHRTFLQQFIADHGAAYLACPVSHLPLAQRQVGCPSPPPGGQGTSRHHGGWKFIVFHFARGRPPVRMSRLALRVFLLPLWPVRQWCLIKFTLLWRRIFFPGVFKVWCCVCMSGVCSQKGRRTRPPKGMI